MYRFTVERAQQAYAAAGLRPRLSMGRDEASCCPVSAWSIAAGRPQEDMLMAFTRDYVLGYIWGFSGWERHLFPQVSRFVEGYEDGIAVRAWIISQLKDTPEELSALPARPAARQVAAV